VKNGLFIGGLFAAAFLLFAPQPTEAQSGPAPFECPWTPVSGTSPSSEGCYGGGTDGCGGTGGANDPPPIPCDQQEPPKQVSGPPPGDVLPAVAQAIAELTAAGSDITGDNCGKIVERACNYMGGGAGLLYKTWGAQYNGHSIDVIVMPDGQHWDVVVSCGGDGTPGSGNTPGVGFTNCCGPLATGCEPNDRYLPCPPLQPLP